MVGLTFKSRVLLTIAFSCATCTIAGIFVASSHLEKSGLQALVEKSSAILSRLEVGANYVASMDTLQEVVKDTVRLYPNGEVPESQKLKVLKSVPIFAAFKIGENGAAEEHYQFRISSLSARNEKNAATSEERERIRRFASNRALKEIVETSDDGAFLKVSRPVFLSEEKGCLTCHGSPSTSPWKNGKDILGHPMENMQNGDLKGVFTIVSSLAPLRKKTEEARENIVIWGVGFTLLALGAGTLAIRKPLSDLNSLSQHIETSAKKLESSSSEIFAVSEKLSSNSTQSAAALEQTVASMEELSSMVKLNSEHSREAARLAEESKKSAEARETEIVDLHTAITDIAQNSRKIEEITSIISDLSFQTNLLSLNAAVEAARAGENGKGFAVVADAVRTLAQKSSHAAKNIGNLIQDEVEKIEKGRAAAEKGKNTLHEIVSSVKKVTALNEEIASASQQQSIGLAQINTAINELEISTQSNATSAGHSTQLAAEMSEQATDLKGLAATLHNTVHGSREN